MVSTAVINVQQFTMKVPADNNGAGVDPSWYAGCGHSFEYLVEPVGIEQRKVPIKDKPIYVLVRDNEKCSPATDTNSVLSRVTESRVKSNYARFVLRLILKVSRLISDVFDRHTRCAVSVQRISVPETTIHTVICMLLIAGRLFC